MIVSEQRSRAGARLTTSSGCMLHLQQHPDTLYNVCQPPSAVMSLQVLPAPSSSLYKEATHLFADFSRLKPGDFRVDVSDAAAQGVKCLKPEFIADYLMQVGGASITAAALLYFGGIQS